MGALSFLDRLANTAAGKKIIEAAEHEQHRVDA